MAKFEKKLQELGFSKDQLSEKLRNSIADFKDDERILKEVKSKLDGVSDEQRAELESDINEITKSLQEQDDELVKDIEKFNRGKKLADGRKKAKEAKAQQQPAPAPQPTPAPTPAPEPKPAPAPAPAPQPEPMPAPEEEPKKKGNAVGWLVGGLLFVLSAGVIYKFAKK